MRILVQMVDGIITQFHYRISNNMRSQISDSMLKEIWVFPWKKLWKIIFNFLYKYSSTYKMFSCLKQKHKQKTKKLMGAKSDIDKVEGPPTWTILFFLGFVL